MPANAQSVDEARAQGYSDPEIAQHLAGDAYGEAKSSGYSDGEIISHFTGRPEMGSVSMPKQPSFSPAAAATPPKEAPGELVSKLSYPFTWLMGQLGNRVDAVEAALGKPVIERIQGKPVESTDLGRALFLGEPPTALPPERPPGFMGPIQGAPLPQGQASYTLARQAGMEKIPAQIASTAGAFAVGGPMNAIGEGAAGFAGALGGMARNSALGQKIAELPGVRDIGSSLSRTFELTPGEKAAEARGMFEGRGIQRLTGFDYATLGVERENAAKIGAKVRGITPEEADSQMRTAVENLARMPPAQALEGLTPEEIEAALKTRDALARIPSERAALGMRPYELGGELPGLVASAGSAMSQAKRARALADEVSRMSVANPFGGTGYRTPGAGPVSAEGEWNPYEAGRSMRAPTESPIANPPPQRIRLDFTRAAQTLPSGSIPNIGEIVPENIGGPMPREPATFRLTEPQRRDFTRLAQQKEAAARDALRALEETGRVGFARGISSHRIDLPAADALLPSVGASDVGYEPRYATKLGQDLLARETGNPPPGTAIQGRPVSDLRTGPTPMRSTQPEQTTAEVEQAAQSRFPPVPAWKQLLGAKPDIMRPSSEALPIYGASQGQRMRNALVLDNLVAASAKPASAFTGADKGVDVSKLGLSGGMSDAWKAKYEGMRVPSRIQRYADNWSRATEPGSLGKISAMQEWLVRTWKPWVTTANLPFTERFAATHAVALFANGEANPRTMGLATLLQSGKYDPAASVGMDFPNAPGVKTLADANRLAIKSGWSGNPQQEFRSLLAPVAKANEAVYSATKKAMGFSRLAKGDTPQQAAEFVRTKLGDYSPENFTNMVNTMSRKAVPFMRFSYQLVPAVTRLVTKRPGTMGAFQETGMNQAARLGLGAEQLKRLGRAAYDPMAIPISRGEGPDSNQVTILDPAMNAGRHIDALFGGRGQGWRGPLNNAVGMLTPPTGIVEQARTLYSNMQGRQLDPHSFQKVPAWVGALPQPVRDAYKIKTMHGYYIAPPDVASAAWGIPNFASAMVNAVQAKTNPVAAQGLKRFEGILPVRTIDMAQADRAARAEIIGKRMGIKEERKSLRSINRRTYADSLAAAKDNFLAQPVH